MGVSASRFGLPQRGGTAGARATPAAFQQAISTPSLRGPAPPAAAPVDQPPAGASAPQPSGEAAANSLPSREEHDRRQAQYFGKSVKALRASITPRVEAQLARVAAAAPGLGPGSRVLDAGAGEGALVVHLQVCPASEAWGTS